MTILSKCVAHWPLDSAETGGITAETHGDTYTLVDRNTCSTGTGVIGGCIYCTASSQEAVYWDDDSTDSDAFTLSAGRGFVIWAQTPGYFDSYTRRILTKRNQFELYRTGSAYSPDMKLKITPASGGSTTVTVQSSLTTSTWYMVYFAINDAGSAIVYSVNGAAKSSAGSFSGFAGKSTSYNVEFGAWSGTGDTTRYWDSLIDEATAFSAELSDAELVSLYNSGSGLAYPFGGSSTITSEYYRRHLAEV